MNRKHLIAAVFLVMLGITIGAMVSALGNDSPAASPSPPSPPSTQISTEKITTPQKENTDDAEEYREADLTTAINSELGTTWDVTFIVRSGMATKGGLVLNDTPYVKNGPKGRTVFIPREIVAEQLSTIRVAAQLKGKTLRVLGVVDEFRDEKQLKAEQVEVLP